MNKLPRLDLDDQLLWDGRKTWANHKRHVQRRGYPWWNSRCVNKTDREHRRRRLEALRWQHPTNQTKMARLKTNFHSVEMKVQRNYLTIRLRRMGKKRCQRSPKKLSSRACFPLICNATPKHTYLWSGFTWPPKCEVTTRLKRMKRLD